LTTNAIGVGNDAMLVDLKVQGLEKSGLLTHDECDHLG